MARPKKPAAPVAPDAPAAEPAVVNSPQMISVNLQEFIKVRDSVITGLANVQAAIQTLCTGYISHSNVFLNEHGAGVVLEGHLAKLSENLLLQSTGTPVAVATNASAKAGKDGERKKRQHDPNAPKRPLTPFFLYMQTARPIIASDLGPESAKGAVSAEGTRRWTSMSLYDKEQWASAYKDNLRLYNARMHAYKNGIEDAKEMNDSAANTYAEVHGLNLPTDVAESIVDAVPTTEMEPDLEIDHEIQAQLEDEDAEGETEALAEERQITPSPTPKPKTPKAKARKTKVTKNTPQVSTPVVEQEEEAIVPASANQGSALRGEKEKSPEKKRKRASKKAEKTEGGAEEGAEKEEMAVETPKTANKPRKRSKKSDA